MLPTEVPSRPRLSLEDEDEERHDGTRGNFPNERLPHCIIIPVTSTAENYPISRSRHICFNSSLAGLMGDRGIRLPLPIETTARRGAETRTEKSLIRRVRREQLLSAMADFFILLIVNR